MKKIWSLAAIVLFAAGSAHAQNLSFGPTVGFGHSWIGSSDKLEDPAKRYFHPAYNVGAKMVYSFVSHWGVSADVKFAGEGGKFGSDSEGDPRTIYRLNYVRVPLQGIYFFEQLGDGVRPKVSLGPSFGFLVGGETKSEEDGETTAEVKSKDYFKSFDLGLNGAIGANFRLMGNKWINADITYYHGLSNINDFDGAKLRNRGIGFNVGILFPIGTVKPGK